MHDGNVWVHDPSDARLRDGLTVVVAADDADDAGADDDEEEDLNEEEEGQERFGRGQEEVKE